MRSKRPCFMEAEAVAFVQGELPPREAAALQSHLQHCETCRRNVGAAREVIERLRDAGGPMPAVPDLAPALLARLDGVERSRLRRARWQRVLLQAAAAAVLLAGAAWWTADRRWAAAPARVATRAAGWLVRTQGDDGGWRAEQLGGQAEFNPALTGLAMLSLLNTAGAGGTAPNAALRRGAAYLLARQATDGRIGPAIHSAPYNHGIATLALAELARRRPDAVPPAALQRAVAWTLAAQTPAGGWGYLGGAEPNVSVTTWQLLALHGCRGLVATNLQPAIGAGLAWLRGTRDEGGFFGYRQAGDRPPESQATTPMSLYCLRVCGEPAPNLTADERRLQQWLATNDPRGNAGRPLTYYTLFFLSRESAASGDPGFAAVVNGLCGRLAADQVRLGGNRGSWAANDQWGSTGGRVYATTLAAMALSR